MQSIKPVNPPPARFSRAKSAYGGFKKTLLVAAVLSAAAFSVSAYETGSLTLSNPEFPEDYISDLYWNLEDFRDFTDWVGETGVVGNNHQTLVVTDSAEGFAGVNTSTLTVEAYSLATLRNSNRLDISIADVTRGYETTWVNAPVRGDNKPTELSGTLDVGVFFNQGLRTDISAFAIGLSSSGSGLTLNGGTLNVSAVAEADMSAESQIKFASTLALPAEGTVLEREDYSLRYYLAPYARNYGFYYVSSIGMIGAPAADPVLVFNSGTLNVTGAIKIQDELTTLDPVIDAPLGRYESNGHYAEIKALGPTDPTTSEHFIASFQVVGMRGGFMSYENYDAQSASVISTPIQYPEPLIHTIHLVNTGMITAKASVEKSLTKNGEAAELQFTDDSSPVEVYGMFAEAHAPQIRVEVANYGFIKTSGGDRNHAVFARTSNNGQIDISAITVRAGEGGTALSERPIAVQDSVGESAGTVSWENATLYVLPDVGFKDPINIRDLFVFYDGNGTAEINPDLTGKPGFKAIQGIDDLFSVYSTGSTLADQTAEVRMNADKAQGRTLASDLLASDAERRHRMYRMTDRQAASGAGSAGKPFAFFAEPYFAVGNRTMANTRADSVSTGIFAGASWNSENASLMLFGMWDRTRTDERKNIDRTDADGWLLGLAGRMNFPVESDVFKPWGEALFASGRSSGDADLMMMHGLLKSEADFRSSQYTAGLRGGASIEFLPRHVIEPSLGVFWVRSKLDDFHTDFGANFGRISYRSTTLSDVEATAQVKWQYLGESEGVAFRPYALLGMTHLLKRDDSKMEVSYGVHGDAAELEREKTYGFAELGLSFEAGKFWDIGLGAGLEFSDSTRSGMFSAKTVFRF